MTNRASSHPRLHALIGDIANDVPEDLAREIECALKEKNLPVQAPTFFACLDAIRRGDGADGQPCHARKIGAGDHASLSRSLTALNALLDLLHAAERARLDGHQQDQLGDFHRDGLIVAARQIARAAQNGLGDALATTGDRLR